MSATQSRSGASAANARRPGRARAPGRIAPRRLEGAPPVAADQAGPAHQARHTLAAAAHPRRSQLGVDARRAVGPAAGMVDRRDRARRAPRRRWPAPTRPGRARHSSRWGRRPARGRACGRHGWPSRLHELDPLTGSSRSPWRRRPRLFLGSRAPPAGCGPRAAGAATRRAPRLSRHHGADRRRGRPAAARCAASRPSA